MISKAELSALLHTLDIPVGEGEQFIDSKDAMPKVAYWEYIWDDVMASGDDYEEIVTYQISFVAKRPRDPKLVELKRTLNNAGIHAMMYHEYVKAQTAPGYYHTYFNIDVSEVITDA